MAIEVVPRPRPGRAGVTLSLPGPVALLEPPGSPDALGSVVEQLARPRLRRSVPR